jgi:predicted lipid carrier protein YhbT
VATIEECRAALAQLAENMANQDGPHRDGDGRNRSLSVHVTDLDTTFSGQLRDGHLTGITTEPQPKADIRLTTTSDDLVALSGGDLSLPGAWASGRVKVDASMRELLRLRTMF